MCASVGQGGGRRRETGRVSSRAQHCVEPEFQARRLSFPSSCERAHLPFADPEDAALVLRVDVVVGL